VADVQRSLMAIETEQHERIDIEAGFEHDLLGN
jgi:hypothetical protein